MVECDLAKVEVAGSNPVSRSRFHPRYNRRKYNQVSFAAHRLCAGGLYYTLESWIVGCDCRRGASGFGMRQSFEFGESDTAGGRC